jgi:hypothetical protein
VYRVHLTCRQLRKPPAQSNTYNELRRSGMLLDVRLALMCALTGD